MKKKLLVFICIIALSFIYYNNTVAKTTEYNYQIPQFTAEEMEQICIEEGI